MNLTENVILRHEALIREISEGLDLDEITLDEAEARLLDMTPSDPEYATVKAESNRAAKKFTKEERSKIMEWLSLGLYTGKIIELVRSEFGKEISGSLVGQYRRTGAKKISEREASIREEAKLTGFSRISERIIALENLVRIILSKFDEDAEWDIKSSRLVSDLSKVIGMLQQHLGEDMVGKTIEGSSAKVVTTLVIPSFDNPQK